MNVQTEFNGEIVQGDLTVDLRFSLTWISIDPFAIQFQIFNDGVVNWVFDIDLLKGGLSSHVGMGDVKCYSDIEYYYIDLDNPSGQAHFRLPRLVIIEFLQRIPEKDIAAEISDSQLYDWLGL